MSPAASAGSSPILLSSLPASAVAGPLPPTGLRPGYDTGNPQTSAIPIHAGQDGVKAGIWECQPGGWHIKNRQDTECVYLLEGRVRITTDGVGEQVWEGRLLRAAQRLEWTMGRARDDKEVLLHSRVVFK
ncbi:hypothetical protein DFJ74DRAFT_493078 [Hyaloraphidium curvatum]|nr:hypothetical protein DFJ74DRAFT_493078 [Hyaloraphidium curvatum]